MLTEKLLTDNDALNLERNYKRFRIVSYVLLAAWITFQVLVAYIASSRYPQFFLPSAIAFILFFLVVWYFAFFKGLKLQKQDLEKQTKLVGSLRVISKSEKDKRLYIGFDSQDLEKLSLNRNIFDAIEVGDTLSLEIARHSKYIFKLSKGDELLINRDSNQLKQ